MKINLINILAFLAFIVVVGYTLPQPDGDLAAVQEQTAGVTLDHGSYPSTSDDSALNDPTLNESESDELDSDEPEIEISEDEYLDTASSGADRIQAKSDGLDSDEPDLEIPDDEYLNVTLSGTDSIEVNGHKLCKGYCTVNDQKCYGYCPNRYGTVKRSCRSTCSAIEVPVGFHTWNCLLNANERSMSIGTHAFIGTHAGE
ncbi:hypothetical protein BO71DRAFT_431514 [Aspergillus ellipticus CBS 707.79]|uniref:Uncharacterized protein n=1 Tax=Aspergillus ellipticus CBS 707.79 TaxID=1448320 RepID=A0A319DNN9_9EURO|nr:hypothetical protein BO71DRAFT_431514 [Aspergillus ellipticus CBS 707.79]